MTPLGVVVFTVLLVLLQAGTEARRRSRQTVRTLPRSFATSYLTAAPTPTIQHRKDSHKRKSCEGARPIR